MQTLLLLSLWLAASLSQNYQPVEITKLVMPKYGLEGGEVMLSCVFTSFQPVYSVKWYQSGKEFFSYLPGKVDPMTVHEQDGISVDVSSKLL